MPAHPKPVPKAKKPGAMRRARPVLRDPIGTELGAEDIPTSAPRRAKAAKVAPKPRKAASAKRAPAEGQTKTDMLVAMLKTPGGATSKEMEAATGWAPHSVRGLLGTLRKRGISVTSTKLPKEPTIYRIPTSKGKPEGDAVGDVL